jgi:hypothetical protein
VIEIKVGQVWRYYPNPKFYGLISEESPELHHVSVVVVDSLEESNDQSGRYSKDNIREYWELLDEEESFELKLRYFLK